MSKQRNIEYGGLFSPKRVGRLQNRDGEQESENRAHFDAPRVTNVSQSLSSGALWVKKHFWILLLIHLAAACGGARKDVTKPYFLTPTNVLGLESGVKKIASIPNATCALADDKSVYCWGVGLGIRVSDFHKASLVIQVTEDKQTADLVGGDQFCSLSTANNLHCWGGDLSLQATTAESNIAIASFNREHSTCGFDAGDKAYCLLDSRDRRNEDLYFFAFTYPGEKVIDLAGGSDEPGFAGHFVALRPDGSVLCAGVFGCGAVYPLIIDGQIRARYPSDTTPVVMQGLPQIRSVGYGCVVGEDGLVYCWGSNQFGELGTGERELFKPPMKPVRNVTQATRVVGDADHRCAVTEGGDLWCWGRNTYGQIGNGHRIADEDCSPSRAGSNDATEYSCKGQYTPVKVLAGVKDVVVRAGGDGHGWTCALTVKGGVKCWGSNSGGVIGDGLPKAED